jgi:hypothetical protein
MLAALLIWLYTLTLFHVYGLAALQGLRRTLRVGTEDKTDLFLTIFTGLVVVTVFAMVAHLFIPLGAIFAIGLTAGALVISFFQRRRLFFVSLSSVPPLVWGILALLLLMVLENATHIPTNLDTGLYHAQTIRWFETYRIVPGLGNLQLRYAFNSSWLVLNAALSLAFLGLRSFHLVNGAIFLFGTFYFAAGLRDLTQNRTPVSGVMKMLFLPLSLYLLSSEMSSAGNDMPVTLIVWATLTLWVEHLESRESSETRKLVIFLLAVFSVTVKLSSLPLIFLAMFILFEHAAKRDWRSVMVLGLAGGLILLVWSVRSVFLSGYPVFPQLQLDIFSVDWKMPADQVRLAINGVVGLARIGNNWRPSIDMSGWQWVPRWFNRLTLNRQLIVALTLASPMLVIFGRRRYPSVFSWKYLTALATAFTGSVFWFISAPDIRFGYGFLISTCVLTLAPFVGDLFDRAKRSLKLLPNLALFALLAFQAHTLLFSFEPSTLGARLLLPADYLPSRAQVCELSNGVNIYCRIEGEPWMECQYDLFPCIPVHRPTAEMRGQTFQEGFRSIPESAP